MDFDLVFISSVEPPPSSSSSSSLWHVSSRHWGIEGIAFNAFGLFAWAIPLTISKITESFVFERDRKTKKKASQARGEQSGPQDQSNCIETLAVMTFLRSPNVLTLSPFPPSLHCVWCRFVLGHWLERARCRLAVFFFSGFRKRNSWRRDTSYIIKVDRRRRRRCCRSLCSSKSPSSLHIEPQLKSRLGFGFGVFGSLSHLGGICRALLVY